MKTTPDVLSLEEKSGMAWEILVFYTGVKQNIAGSYHQGKMAFTQTSPSRDWKCLRCNMYSTQWKDTSPNASMLSKATLAPPRILLHVMRDKSMCCLLISEQWFLEQYFHPMKGTSNLVFFEERPDLPGEILFLYIREEHQRASSYNQDKRAISQTPQTRVLELPGSTVSPNQLT